MKWAVVCIYLLGLCHIHLRGRARLPLGRQMFDHSTFMAPLNMFLHYFSKVPATPYLKTSDFADLAPLQQNWQVIREEAENLLKLQKIKAAEQNNDAGLNSSSRPAGSVFICSGTAPAIRRPSSCAPAPWPCCARF